MNKRIISLLLCGFLVLGMTMPVYADEIEISEASSEVRFREISIATPEAFLEFAENCRLDTYSQQLAVTLTADIDLTGHSFQGIPIFSGIFEGNGHKITGLVLTNAGSMQGLFRHLTNTAVVQNLTVACVIQPGGSKNEIGAIAGRNEGEILNCVFSGILSGNHYVGGLVGTNAVSGIIENCRIEGEIHGSHFVGGIAGENCGVIRNSENTAFVNTTAQQNHVEISDITLDTLTDTEDVNTVTDIGGIAGISSGVIRNCKNHADVGYQHMGYNIGGIAGTQTGYIAECENYGKVHGRKEVGGIVGQMEPLSLIEYTEDTLQILQGQLNTMSSLVNRASGNAQTNANGISTQMGILREQAQTARDAVDALFPDADNPELPDADTIVAAQNTLSATLDAMPGTLNSIASATQATLYSLNRDLNAISGQISAMGQTLNNASENLGGTITDISDQDTPELLTSKVDSCRNYGEVLADLNVGGIAGAVAFENDLDTLEDWLSDGETSLNFRAEVRTVIINCQNNSTITGSKQNVGGITGWQSLGLVKESSNTGKIDAENADHVGGISGLSTGYIRSDYAKCEIHGKAYVGGIAGSGTVVTDSLSQVKLMDTKEKQGNILGYAEYPNADVEDPISRNIYLKHGDDRGAIDGISYSGLAEGMELESFLTLETLPEMFRKVTVRFRFADGTEKKISLRPGNSLSAGQIPAIPEKDGFSAKWDGLAEADLGSIVYDLSFESTYIPYRTTIQSTQTRENGLPMVLAEGTFTADATVSVENSDAAPELSSKETMVEAWMLRIPDGAENIRFLLPDGMDSAKLKLTIQNTEGTWHDVSFVQDGSYLVFPATTGNMELRLVQEQSSHLISLFVGISILLVILVVLLIFFIHKNKNTKAFANVSKHST